MMVAAEPMENFGVARYRLEDYADCVGTGGCYWADVDAQTQARGGRSGSCDCDGEGRARSWRWCWISMRLR